MRKVLALVAVGLLALPATASAAVRDVHMTGTSFTPGRVIALRGDEVRWTNTDLQQHNVTGASFASGNLNPGAFWSTAFGAPGSFFYRCTIHLFMTGTVSVYDLYLQGPVTPLAYGRSATLRGLAPESSQVTIERVGAGPVTTVQAGADGGFTTTIPGVPGQYRATAAGRVSGLVRVVVRPRVSIRARRSGRSAVVTVGTTPSQRGGTVALEKRRRGSWARVAAKRLNASSKAVFRTALSQGRTTFRARLVRSVGGYATATSRSVSVRR